MRNLILSCERIGVLAPTPEQSILSSNNMSVVMSIDSPTNRLFIVHINDLIVFDITNANVIKRISLHNVIDSTLSSLSNVSTTTCSMRVIGCQYLPEHEAVCTAFANGALVLVDVQTGDLNNVGNVASGIAGIKWSTDDEVCVIIARSGFLMLLTSDFDVIHDSMLHENLNDISSADISWRGDSQFFVVIVESTLSSMSSSSYLCRNVFVIERNGSLHSRSSCSPGDVWSLTSIAWRPSGDLFAVAIEHDGGSDGSSFGVALYERNGLQHGSVPSRHFPKQRGPPLQLAFSADDVILAVRSEHCIDLFTRNNYHWYLKYSVSMSSSSLSGVIIDPEYAFRLVAFNAVCVRTLEFAFTPCVSSLPSSTAAVVDGCEVLLTPLGRALIPPPLCAARVLCSSNIIAVCFLHSHDSKQSSPSMATLLCDDTLTLFSDTSGCIENATHNIQLQVANKAFHHCRLLTWPRSDSLVAVRARSDGLDEIVQVKVPHQNQNCLGEIIISINHVYTTPLPAPAIAVFVDGHSNVLVELEDASVMCYNTESKTLNSFGKLPIACLSLSCASFGSISSLIGLNSRSGALYVGDTLVSQRCSSFVVHSDALIFSNNGPQNVLYFVLRDVPLSLALTTTDPHAQRLVERGALLVATAGGIEGVLTVLQMPRGNLEGVYPRSLLLKVLSRMLQEGSYGLAFQSARRHRIDLNILYDASPYHFLKNIHQVVSQIGTPDLVNEFITSLRGDNVCETLFPSCKFEESNIFEHEKYDKTDLSSLRLKTDECSLMGTKESSDSLDDCCDIIHAPTQGDAKVNTVCNALLRVFDQGDGGIIASGDYVMSALCALSKMIPPRYTEMLRIVQRLKDSDERERRGSSVNVSSAVQFSIFLCEESALYQCALGMYDLELAKLVAQHSQRDPKEYTLQLNELASLPNLLRRARIDLHLHRFSNALRHLHAHLIQIKDQQTHSEDSSLEDEVVELVDSQSDILFPLALSLLRTSLPHVYTRIANNRVEVLLKRGHKEQAANLLMSLNRFEDAVTAYANTGNWRTALALTFRTDLDIITVATTCVAALDHNPNATDEVATLLVHYCQDVDGAVLNYVRHEQYIDALRIAKHESRDDLVLTLVEPSLLQTCLRMTEQLQCRTQRYDECCSRLRRLRASETYFQESVRKTNSDCEEDDTASVVSNLSAFSLSSQSSVTSWASRPWSTTSGVLPRSSQCLSSAEKRSRKRLLRMKAGDPKEEEFLLKNIRSLVPQPADADKVRSLLRAATLFEANEQAAKMQHSMLIFLQRVSTQEEKHMLRTDHTTVSSWPSEVYANNIQANIVCSRSYSTWALMFLPTSALSLPKKMLRQNNEVESHLDVQLGKEGRTLFAPVNDDDDDDDDESGIGEQTLFD